MSRLSCTRLLRVGSLIVFCCVIAATADAQTERRFTFDVGGGFTPPVGQISNRLNAGWNFGVGGGMNLTQNFGVGVKYMYNGFGVNNGVLALAGAPAGDANVWSITAEPKLQLAYGTQFFPYVVGGVGYYRRTVNFTQPTLATTLFLDPFFGVLVPGLVGTNQLLGRSRSGGIGGSLGAGLSFAIGNSGARFFTEARYHYADTGNVPTRMVPVTFGIRF